jgi:hypothetical protein
MRTLLHSGPAAKSTGLSATAQIKVTYAMTRARLPNRRFAETFEFSIGGLHYTCTVGRFADGAIAELFLTNHKSNSAADTAARDAAIAFSFAVQHGADAHAIRRAFCRDSRGQASGPLGRALDILLWEERP